MDIDNSECVHRGKSIITFRKADNLEPGLTVMAFVGVIRSTAMDSQMGICTTSSTIYGFVVLTLLPIVWCVLC